MGKVFEGVDDRLARWIAAQPMFFVGTAPAGGDGHVNVSPKGLAGSFAVLGPHEVAYLDFVGSGAETLAHLRENGRIVVMFCAFAGPPKIVRLHGRGEVLPADGDLAAAFDPPEHAVRSIVRVDVERVSDSCGYGVPLLGFEGKRTQYDAWVEKKVRDGGLDDYVATKNAVSIDGLPAVSAPAGRLDADDVARA